MFVSCSFVADTIKNRTAKKELALVRVFTLVSELRDIPTGEYFIFGNSEQRKVISTLSAQRTWAKFNLNESHHENAFLLFSCCATITCPSFSCHNTLSHNLWRKNIMNSQICLQFRMSCFSLASFLSWMFRHCLHARVCARSGSRCPNTTVCGGMHTRLHARTHAFPKRLHLLAHVKEKQKHHEMQKKKTQRDGATGSRSHLNVRVCVCASFSLTTCLILFVPRPLATQLITAYANHERYVYVGEARSDSQE